jgi:hypothetical protein
MVLELAVSASCDIIVTYNKSDFQGVEQFGIRVLTAKEFLQEIGFSRSRVIFCRTSKKPIRFIRSISLLY